MTLRLLALVLPLFISSCATADLPRPAVRPAWACTARISSTDTNLSVMRTLDDQGKQLGVDIRWSVAGLDRRRLSLAALEANRDAGEPPITPKGILVSWSDFPASLQRAQLLVVLHAADEAPNPLDGVRMIPYLNRSVGAVISWQRVSALAQVSRSAQLSLVDDGGRVIRSASVDLAVLDRIVNATRTALDQTRTRAATFRKSCEPITEWMTL